MKTWSFFKVGNGVFQTQWHHDDVIKWKHFPHYCFFRWIHRSPVDSPYNGQRHRALMFSLICAWKKRLIKQSRRRWFETPSHSLWCHRNDTEEHNALDNCCNRVQNSMISRTARYRSTYVQVWGKLIFTRQILFPYIHGALTWSSLYMQTCMAISRHIVDIADNKLKGQIYRFL